MAVTITSTSAITRRQFARSMAGAAALVAGGSLLGSISRGVAEEAADETWACDVLVLGAGAAGVTAAAAAAEAGMSVILLEKESWMAGSSSLAIGTLYGAGTQIQKAADVDDNPEALLEYFLSRGGDKLDASVERFAAEHFGETIDWLAGDLGVAFKEGVSIKGADTVARGHSIDGGSVRCLEKVYDSAVAAGVDFRFSTSVESFVVDDAGAVTGAVAQTADGKTVNVSAQKTIVATGGFCRNSEMIAEYMPDYAGVYTEVGIGCTGEGLQMGLEVGAAYIGHGGTNGILACPVEPGQSKLIAKNALWVAADGKRFNKEDGQTHDIYYQVAAFDDQTFYALYDQALVDALADDLKEKLQLGLDLGIFASAETAGEAAGALGIDAESLEQTLADYNAMAQTGEDTEFGKKTDNLVELVQAPYYMLTMGVCTHGSFGGYSVNERIEVLDTEGAVIENLYAAGEVSCGSFIYDDYPAGGCGLNWAYTSGRYAGINAAAAISQTISEPTANDDVEKTVADMQAERKACPEVEGLALDPHSEKHGDIACATCHSTDDGATNTLFCTTCHNDVEAPEGWADVENGAREQIA